jgi:hypothetical protein
VTLVEFIAPVRNKPHKYKCMAVLYFSSRHQQIEALTADEISKTLLHAHVLKARVINVSDVLSKCGEMVESSGVKGKAHLWRLTATGKINMREILGIPEWQPELEHSVGSLEALAANVADADVRGYLEESIKCLRFDAIRAAIVFLWAGAASVLREKCISKGLPELNDAVHVHDTRAREIRKADDFAYIKEKVMLLAAEGVGVLDKNERTTLEDALDLRNKCGHPTKYTPGAVRASSFVEDVTGILFK